MKAIIARLAAISIFTLGLTANAIATPIVLTATLNGANESPANGSLGTGFAKVVYDGTAHTLGLDVSFSGLLGPDTAAHIHCCTVAPFTGTAGVATTTLPLPTFVGFPLGVTSRFLQQSGEPFRPHPGCLLERSFPRGSRRYGCGRGSVFRRGSDHWDGVFQHPLYRGSRG